MHPQVPNYASDATHIPDAHLLHDALIAARARTEEILPLLRLWIETNSHSRNVAGANAMGDLLAASLAETGMNLVRRQGDGVGDHLLWHTDAWSRPGASRVVLVGHHDTVFPPGAFELCEERGGRLHGPGAVDMKGGLAIGRTALAALFDAGILHDLPLAFISVADEEIGSRDSRPFLEKTIRGASAALVLETGRLHDAIVTRRKGAGGVDVAARGRSAHSGNDHASGLSAIRALCRFVDAAEGLTDYDAGVTVNVGVISGGEARNTIPDLARCELDFRFVRQVEGDELMKTLENLARAEEEASGARLVIEGGVHHPALEKSRASQELLERYAACAKAAGLGFDEAPLVGGGSDANIIGSLGVPTIDGLGARGGGLHTRNEQIEIAALGPKSEALVRFLCIWAREARGDRDS